MLYCTVLYVRKEGRKVLVVAGCGGVGGGSRSVSTPLYHPCMPVLTRHLLLGVLRRKKRGGGGRGNEEEEEKRRRRLKRGRDRRMVREGWGGYKRGRRV